MQRPLLTALLGATGDENPLALDPGALRRLPHLREGHDLHAPREIFHGDDRHCGTLLRHHLPNAQDDGAECRRLIAERLIAKVANKGAHIRLHRWSQRVHWVIAQIDAHQLALPAQPFARRGLGDGWECGDPRSGKLRHCIKETDLPSRALALRTGAARDRVIKGEQDLRRVPEATERPNLRQRFKDALVRKAQVNPLTELL